MSIQHTTTTVPEESPQFIPGEINMCRLPFFASGTKGLKNKSIEYRTTQHLTGGGTLEMRWVVAGNSKFGHPGPFAEKVHHVIETIAFEQAISNGGQIPQPILVNLTDVCRRLNLDRYDSKKDRYVIDSRDRRRVKDAIRSIRFAAIVCEKAVRLNGEFRSLDDDSTLYERVRFAGEKLKDGTRIDQTQVFFASWYLESLNAGYLRPIDYGLLIELSDKAGAAPKLYKFLAYQFANRCFGRKGPKESYIEVPYEEIRQIIDIASESALSLARRSFEKAHQALLDAGFINHEPEWVGEGRQSTNYAIRYEPGPRAKREYRDGRKALARVYQLELFANKELPKLNESLQAELADCGVDEDGIKMLLANYTPDQIKSQIEHFKWNVSQGKKMDNPGGWLIQAIKKGYKIPDGVKQMRVKLEIDAIQTEHAKLKAEADRLEEARQAMHETKYQKLEDDFALLSENDRREIESKIKLLMCKEEENNSFVLQMINKGDLRRPILRAKFYAHLERLISE